MAKEFKLPYTASEISEKLQAIDNKADLIDGKIPLSQLPDDIGPGEEYLTEVWWKDIKDKPTNVSAFDNDKGYLTEVPKEYITETEINAKFSDIDIVIAGLDETKANIDIVNGLSQSILDLDEATQKTANLVTTISSTSTHVEYPSARAVYSKLADKQDTLTIETELINDNNNPVTSGAVKDAIDGVIEIASGKCKTYVFDSYEELSLRLLGDENGEGQDTVLLDSLKSGDVLLIRALSEPDFWWEEVKTRAMVRANFESEIIVSGYGVARVLETTKCDLTDYALSSDIPTQLSELGTDENHLLVTQAEKNTWSAKSTFSGNYNDLTNKPTIPTIPSSLPANGGNADTVDNKHASDFALVAAANQFNGEQKFMHSQYCPTITDSASGIGCAFKASRGLFNEALIDKVIMTASTGKIPFYKYTGTSSGSPSNLTQVSYIDGNGVYQGNVSQWGGKQFRTASSGDTGKAGYITFIL